MIHFDQIYQISAQGMQVEKLRLDTIAYNIANQNSLQSLNGSGFQALKVITTTKPFSEFIQKPNTAINEIKLASQSLPPNKVYEPEHPAADKEGYVSYVNVNTINEMTTLLRASRAYEANIKVINTAHSLFLQTLTIGEER